MPAAPLSKTELFERLAAGPAGVTVVTPNQRLARTLREAFDAVQRAKGLPSWEDADILPLEAWLARGYEEMLYADGGERLPTLLSPAQSRALWEEAIRASRWAGVLLDVPQTAASAQRAWQAAQEWRIAGALDQFGGTEDTQAFADWARAYQRRLKKDGFVDASQLWDLDVPKPALLVAYGFDIVPGRAGELFEKANAAACHPERKGGRATRTSFATPRDELEAAARWARARLEAGATRIGVVVPDLQRRRREAARVFARVLGRPGAVELSLGEPLSDYPLVAFALNWLEFPHRALPFEDASRLLRSPFLGGAEGEAAGRARLDAQLRRAAGVELSLPKLIAMIDGEPGLRRIFESVFEKAKAREGRAWSAHDWARDFSESLASALTGGRALNSEENQARAKFNELLGEFARLGAVSGRFSAREAVARLRRLCADTLFQPEGEGAPVQVLGLLESAGLEFDALWVSGLTDEAWPQRVRPDPFLPVLLQRRAGIPEASAEASLALDRRRTEGWLGAAAQVVLSWARREEDRELSPSPLIAGVPEAELALPSYPSFRDLLFEARALEGVDDAKAVPLQEKRVHGGTRVLADQAACPFRAFARHRLGAQALEAPAPGPDARQRGQLLHALMAELWTQLRSSAALSQDLGPAIDAAAAKAVAGIEGPLAALEKQRLIRLARDWLQVERGRAAFEVVQIEQKRRIGIGGLALSGRIDRMDRLEDGTHAILDYKTGNRVTPSDWQGPRPDDPQLPLYAVSAGEDVSTLAYAKLRAGEMGFYGFSANEGRIPGVKPARSWPDLVAGWKKDLEALAAGFAAGDARVDPKRALQTCRHCDLQPLCRVHERLSALADEEGGNG